MKIDLMKRQVVSPFRFFCPPASLTYFPCLAFEFAREKHVQNQGGQEGGNVLCNV